MGLVFLETIEYSTIAETDTDGLLVSHSSLCFFLNSLVFVMEIALLSIRDQMVFGKFVIRIKLFKIVCDFDWLTTLVCDRPIPARSVSPQIIYGKHRRDLRSLLVAGHIF